MRAGPAHRECRRRRPRGHEPRGEWTGNQTESGRAERSRAKDPGSESSGRLAEDLSPFSLGQRWRNPLREKGRSPSAAQEKVWALALEGVEAEGKVGKKAVSVIVLSSDLLPRCTFLSDFTFSTYLRDLPLPQIPRPSDFFSNTPGRI